MRSIVLLAIGALAALPAGAATLARGPYLQLATPQSVTVVWRTATPAACALAVHPLGTPLTTIPGPTGTTCAIALDGLTPGTQYGYTPLADGTALAPEAVFFTDEPTLPFTFAVLGDSGSGGPHQYGVAERLRTTRADFLLHTGDMIYEDGAAIDFDPKFFRPYRDLIRNVVFWPCVGNHDIATAGGVPWRDAFYTPANNPAGNEHYYSFDFGNAHIAVLDSNADLAPGSPQYTFLDADLAASSATWKFVAFHHPPYSSGNHGSDPVLQANLGPLFDRHAVDVVFSGHDHHYERTVPLRGGQTVAPGQGTVYVVTGGGGKEIRTLGVNAFTAYGESAFHFVRVAVDGGRLLLQMIREDGLVRDTLVLEKGSVTAPRCGDNVMNQTGEQCDGDDRFACTGGCAADCTCTPVCGDGLLDPSNEDCDGRSDAACPGLCRSTCRCGGPADFLTLPPSADTYLEEGTEATWDHGAATHLDVDQRPTDFAYLRFDLTGVPVPIVAAQLTLRCSNASTDGGTIYPVRASSWVEGTRTGADSTSAGGPGLTWSEVDTNGDGTIDLGDSSPYAFDPSDWIRVLGPVTVGQDVTRDVTRAFQGGPGLYSLALRNHTSDGAVYASREASTASQRPRLRLELGAPLPTTTSTSTSSTTRPPTSTTTTTTRPPTTTTSTTRTTTTSTTTTTRPGPTGVVVADVTVREKGNGSLGAGPILEVDGRDGKRKNTFLRIAVSGVAPRTVASARLRLQVGAAAGSGSNSGGRIHALPGCDWTESGLTWSTRPPIPSAVLASVAALNPGDLAEFDLSSVVTGDGTYCFALDSLSADGVAYNSREGSERRPQVILEVAP